MIKHPKIWLIISLITLLGSIAIIAFIRPLWGIDFTGGSLIEVEAEPAQIEAISNLLSTEFKLETTIQPTPEHTLLIRTSVLDETTHKAVLTKLQEQKLLSGPERRFESIGPTVGAELRRKAVIAVGAVILMMVVYLAYAFRGATGLISSWKFGLANAYALFHDLLFVTALFVLLGKFWHVSIDTLFVTAQLAIMGYSVNDTIVIFNRFKSEWRTSRSRNLLDVMDHSVKSTLMRSLNTSITILLTQIILLLFGGATIHWFIVALTAGTIVGTYSSIFVATPALYFLARRK